MASRLKVAPSDLEHTTAANPRRRQEPDSSRAASGYTLVYITERVFLTEANFCSAVIEDLRPGLCWMSVQ